MDNKKLEQKQMNFIGISILQGDFFDNLQEYRAEINLVLKICKIIKKLCSKTILNIKHINEWHNYIKNLNKTP